jgi:hypothetical protein
LLTRQREIINACPLPLPVLPVHVLQPIRD